MDRRAIAVDKTRYLIVPEGSPQVLRRTEESGLELLCAFFPPSSVADCRAAASRSSPELLDATPAPLGTHSCPIIAQVRGHDTIVTPHLVALRETLRAPEQRAPAAWFEERMHLLLEAIATVNRDVVARVARLPSVRASTRLEIFRRLDRAREYFDECYADAPNLSGAAQVACLSNFHFLRLFKAAFRQTPHQYLTERRFAVARRLLRETKRTVTDISFAVGFLNVNLFGRVFRERYQTTPQGFRKAA